MKITEKITKEMKEAQKSKDSFKLNALRMIKSALDYKLLDLKKDKLEDNDAIAVLKTIKKQRKESIDAFKKAGKDEAADKEQKELAIVETFLPASVSKEEIEKTVDAVIQEVGAQSQKEMGKVMKAVMEKFKGQMVDGKEVSNIVKARLTPAKE